MNTKKLINAFTDNIVAKVVCLVAAILRYILHQVSVLEKKSFTVPLEVNSDALYSNLTSVPQFVKVTVRTKSENISSVTPSEIKASLNLNSFAEEGSYNVPVSISLSQSLMLLDPLELQVKPEFITVTLDEKIEKYVPVIPSVSGEVSHGYVIKSIEVIPSTVKITGPKKIVEKTNYIYSEKVNVKGAATGFSVKVPLDNINRLVTANEEEKFKVTVFITPAPSEQSFKGILPSLIHLDEKFITSGKLPPMSFTLAGTVPVMENFKLDSSCVYVDLSAVKAPGRYELPVIFSLPAGISVKEKNYENVTLELLRNPEFTEEVSEDEEEKTEYEINIPLEPSADKSQTSSTLNKTGGNSLSASSATSASSGAVQLNGSADNKNENSSKKSSTLLNEGVKE
ncbi:MAG: hypothetical protein K6E78_02015 [Treponema sp.]|nr:hypothetical protein [Treponema sp.]